MSEQEVFGFIFSIVVICVAVLFASLMIYLIPLVVVSWGGWYLYKAQINSPVLLEKKSKEHTQLLYQQVLAHGESVDIDVFVDKLAAKMPELPSEIFLAFGRAACELFNAENIGNEVPAPPAVCNSLEGAKYRDYIIRIGSKSEGAVDIAVDAIVESHYGFMRFIPPVNEADATLNCRIMDRADNLSEIVQLLVEPFFSTDAMGLNLFKALRSTIIRNQYEACKVKWGDEDNPKLVPPYKYKGDDVIEAYLKNTPLIDLFDIRIPVEMTDEKRFQHTWCVAPSGKGKTQLIQYLVSRDLKRVERGEASVVVMDSAGEMIDEISSLKVFAEGQPLHGKLIVIRPDLNYPPALNLFDFGKGRDSGRSADEKEKFTNAVLEQLVNIVDAILGEGGTLTPKQKTLFSYTVRLLVATPDANLDTFASILRIDKASDLKPYRQYIATLSKAAQDFFENDYCSRDFNGTKKEVGWRLSGLRENNHFERIFAHNESKLDLFTELNSAKVILIHTDIDNLKAEHVNVLGRYFIGLLSVTSQERISIPREKRLPVFTYIDEAADYISTDRNIASLLDQVRKMRMGMFLAHQRCAQIKDRNVLDALSSTAITFASTDTPGDFPLVSKAMRTDQDFAMNQPERHFAVSIRGSGAFSFEVPFLALENMEKMSDEESAVVFGNIRDRYYAKYVSDLPEVGVEQSEEEGATGEIGEKAGEPVVDADNPEI